MTDYIKRSDAIRAMAQYMMDTALIDNPEASDRIEEWECNIAAPVMSTVKAADVRENVRGEWIHDQITRNGNTVYTPNAKCSICDCYVFQECNFCPNCGAQMMRGGANERLHQARRCR